LRERGKRPGVIAFFDRVAGSAIAEPRPSVSETRVWRPFAT